MNGGDDFLADATDRQREEEGGSSRDSFVVCCRLFDDDVDDVTKIHILKVVDLLSPLPHSIRQT